PGAVGVVPRRPDGSLVLVRQFRKARECECLEIVAGLLDPGEAPAAAAARELREETGLEADTLEPLGEIWASPGYTDECIHLFFADCSAPAGAHAPDEDERIEVVGLAPAAFEALIASGQIHDAKTLAAWTLCRARFSPPPPGAAS
ncbi:MAG: NUDIX hydrolase, partial [Candidatus Marinimicrobia bacterium]|nr:NUDIX hydrolase [Candidatus Neomarinimicrobiota bacterium]